MQGNSETDIPGFSLTKEFLELTFEREVECFDTKPGTDPGDNFMSVIHGIKVLFKGDEEEKHLIIKCYPKHAARRDYLDQLNIFQKEFFVYGDLLPQLNKLAVERKVEEVIFTTAPFHAGNVVGVPSLKFNMEPWSKENFILMTDIRSKGFEMVDRIKGLSFEHAALVLKEIAKLHSLSLAYKKEHKLGKLIDKYPTLKDNVYNTTEELADQLKTVFENVNNSTLKVVEQSLGKENPAYLGLKKLAEMDSMEFLRRFFLPEGIDEDFIESHLRIKPEEDKDYVKDPWLVLNHGDCWMNNILFLHEQGSGKPLKVTCVDFQIFNEGCPTVELAYFLFSSVRAEVRIPRQEELLRIYFNSLVENCAKLQVDLLPGFTFDNFLRRYRRAELFGLLISMMMLSVVLKPKSDAVDMDKMEGGDIGELFGNVMEGGEKNTLYTDEVTATILKMYQDGTI